MTARREYQQDVADQEREAALMCSWCSDQLALGTLVARQDDDPIPAAGMLGDCADIARLCLDCGWHFHGGVGRSGEYYYLVDPDRHKKKRGKQRG